MNLFRKFLLLLLFGLFIIVVAACGGEELNSNSEVDASENAETDDSVNAETESNSEEIESITIDVASVYEDAAAPIQGTHMFAELVDEATDGRIQVNVFPAGSLGSENEIYEAVSSGDLDMVMGGFTGVDMYAPEYMYFITPFLFSSKEHLENAFYSELGDDMFESMKESNFQFLAANYRGVRHMTSNQAFSNPDELSNVRLRLPEIEAWVAAWSQIGATPTAVALPEMYSSLQTGVVDASEGPFEQMATFNLEEVQDYLILTEHVHEMVFLWINNGLFDSLSADDQNILQDAAEEAMAYADEQAEIDADVFYQQLVDGGMEVIEPDVASFVEKAQPVFANFFEEKWNVTTLDEVNSYR
ncbi:hypothetical protein CR194_07360 [Salipaludibacillus keqinensis]|uniref:C4-dicarboxylate ABC transporter substrate-binding protein n=1 Tax=Salipaludibacillus keqinensis TaxID=2045207 RepID=A0A323TD67_9BACI|nr:TRAP transporter substrate-binding protein [Salipaludibacillus keqinensis]PYZ93009.1 hypothetical protein CR194_07360 [Salipaludibacillus keqinensis]